MQQLYECSLPPAVNAVRLGVHKALDAIYGHFLMLDIVVERCHKAEGWVFSLVFKNARLLCTWVNHTSAISPTFSSADTG